MLIFFINLSVMEFYFRYLTLFPIFLVIDGFEWFWMQSLTEYSVNARVPQNSILSPNLFLLYTNNLPDNVISNIDIYADNTTLYSICNQVSYLWRQVTLASESDLRDNVEWGREWLVDFNAVKS